MSKRSKKKKGKNIAVDTAAAGRGEPSTRSFLPQVFWRRKTVHVVLLVLAGLAAYSNTFNVPFQFDDLQQIEKNPVITTLGNFFSSSKGYEFNPRRFIGYLTFAVNYHFGGYGVVGYHIVNLVIHVINAVLVYFLVLLIFRTHVMQPRPAPGRTDDAETRRRRPAMIALFSALLFVAHPIQTEAVTYIVQRLTSLAAMFFLLSVTLYMKGRTITEREVDEGERDLPGGHPLPRSHALNAFACYALSLVSAVLAMKTKEIAFTLPFVIILCEFLFFGSGIKRKIMFLLPVLLTMAIIPISIMGINKPLGEILSDLSDKTRVQTNIPRWDYLMTQLRVVTTYVRLIFFPARQNLDYDYPIYHSLLQPPVFLSFLFLLSLVGVAVYFLYRSRRGEKGGDPAAVSAGQSAILYASPYYRLISFGIFWFFITLSVESSVIPIADVIFEHRVYLPSAGAFIAIVGAAFFLADKLGGKRRKVNSAVTAVFVAVVLVLSIATYSRNTVWQSRLSLWQDVVAKSPSKGRGYNDLGNAYNRAGRLDEAEKAYRRGLTLSPDNYDAHNDLGIVYAKQKQTGRAIEEFGKAIALNPKYARPYSNLGIIYSGMNRMEEAIGEFSRAIALDPDNAATYRNRGVAYARTGDLKKAAADFRTACRMGDREGCANLDRLR